MIYTPLPKDPPGTIRKFIKEAGIAWIGNGLLYLVYNALFWCSATIQKYFGYRFSLKLQFDVYDFFEVDGGLYFSLFGLEFFAALLQTIFLILFFSIPIIIISAIVIRVFEKIIDNLPEKLS